MNKTIYLNAVLLFTGQLIGQLETYIALAKIMRKFRVEYLEDTPMDYMQMFAETIPARQLNLAFKDL